jgi:ribosomal protein L9
VKRKRILPTEQSLNEQRKNVKKNQNAKKRKTEEKYVSDDVDELPKKKDIFLTTKTTMPSSTFGTFQKSSFTDALKQKVHQGKSGIRKVKVNNHHGSSNVSRHTNKD